MSEKLSAPQLAALSHPFDADKEPDPACRWYGAAKGRSAILTCDVDNESIRVFGGPVWHASVCPPIRRQAKKLLAGVGEGVLFEEPGVRDDIYHLRRRMTREEIERLGGGYAQ